MRTIPDILVVGRTAFIEAVDKRIAEEKKRRAFWSTPHTRGEIYSLATIALELLIIAMMLARR